MANERCFLTIHISFCIIWGSRVLAEVGGDLIVLENGGNNYVACTCLNFAALSVMFIVGDSGADFTHVDIGVWGRYYDNVMIHTPLT